MGGPKKRRYTTRATASPSTHTTAKIVVFERLRGARIEVEDAKVEVIGIGANGRGLTNAAGIFKIPKLFRAGQYQVDVRKSAYGPPKSGGAVVYPGTVTNQITFLPNSKLPKGVSQNVVEIEIAYEHPRIIVHAVEDRGVLGMHDIPGADVTVIGLDSGPTDKQGGFESKHAQFGAYNVRVAKAGLVPQTQHGSVFYRRVELRAGAMQPRSRSRDIELEVVFGVNAPNLPPNPTEELRIWASGAHTPHMVLEDPRMTPRNVDTARGQSGWDMGLAFNSFMDLATSLSRAKPAHLGGGGIRRNTVARLAFVAHGMPGVVDVDQNESNAALGVPTPAGSSSLTDDRIAHYDRELELIRDALRQNAVVYVAACQAADGTAGENLLKSLSRRWPTVTVVGIRTLAAVVSGMSPPGSAGKMHGGLRDTRYANGNRRPGEVRDYENTAFVSNLNRLPWMSETSPHATVARDGNIIRRGDNAG